jgi:hypothetical protein
VAAVSWNWVNLKVTMNDSRTPPLSNPRPAPPPATVASPPTGRNVVEFVGNTLADVDPCPLRRCVYSAIGGQRGVMAYSGMAFTPEEGPLGSLVLTGGGHADYWGNEVYVFDLATSRWRRINNPSTALNGTNADADPVFNKTYCEYGDGTPAASHTYDHLRCVPGKNELLVIGASAGYGISPSSWNGYAHACNLTTGKWRRASMNSNDMRLSQACTCWDSKRGKVWKALTGNTGALASYDPATEMFTPYLMTGRPNLGFDPVAFYHPGFDLMIVQHVVGYYKQSCRYTLTAIDLEKPNAGGAALTLAGDIPPDVISFTDSGWGVDWSPEHNAAFVFAGNPDHSHVWRIDPPLADALTNPWRVTKIALPRPMPGGEPSGIYAHWRYCTTIRKFAFVSHNKRRVALWTP